MIRCFFGSDVNVDRQQLEFAKKNNDFVGQQTSRTAWEFSVRESGLFSGEDRGAHEA